MGYDRNNIPCIEVVIAQKLSKMDKNPKRLLLGWF